MVRRGWPRSAPITTGDDTAASNLRGYAPENGTRFEAGRRAVYRRDLDARRPVDAGHRRWSVCDDPAAEIEPRGAEK